MDKNDNSQWEDLPTDALVEILARLPANARLRFRLVCRHWRELIDQRTATDTRRRTKIIGDAGKAVAPVIIDLLSPAGSARDLWQRIHSDTARRYSHMSIVSTCNGLVCLCDDDTPGGAITVANPSTGEAVRLPPLPMSSAAARLNNGSISSRSWNHQTYSFGYHQTMTTGPRYKVVHVPCEFDRFWQPEIVHVFTLGEASWRDVRTGADARCSLRSNLADVDGTVYWLTEDAGKIMSFDLRHERVTRIEPLPVPAPAMPSIRCLTKVHGRLGVAVEDDTVLTVWVLEGERWSRRYVLQAQGPRWQEKWMMVRPRRELAGPHLVHGDYFLTLARESSNMPLVLYRHTLSVAAAARSQQDDGVVQRITDRDEGEVVVRLFRSIYRTFVYVETKEPLSLYNAALGHK